MNKWNSMRLIIIMGVLALSLTSCFDSNDDPDSTSEGMDHSQMGQSSMDSNNELSEKRTTEVDTLKGKEFTLTAQTSNLEISSGVILPVWTFNNSVPGPQIRVKQGDHVNITLKNELPDPVTIHWHGVPVPNNMDGIPGVTQNAVQPGQSFVYNFKADVPGTYWYHSHQDGVNQLDRGLYGSFIVEGTNEEKVNRDFTLMLDEWASSGMDLSDMNNDMPNMDHSQMNMDSSNSPSKNSPIEHDMSMYDLFSINGKSGDLVSQLPVKEGENVRLRLINAGYQPHQIHLHGHEFKVTATDGQPINNPGVLKDNVIYIGPGERYDIEFTANNPGQWFLEEHGDDKAVPGMKAVIAYEGVASGTDKSNAMEAFASVDLTSYGQSGNNTFTLDQQFDLEYTMDLNTEMKNGNMVYTINGKTFPDTEVLTARKGDNIKVRLTNNSTDVDHPMHLHGHFFQVLSKNGKPLEGSPIFKDTINLKPGEEYVVAFEADNPGNWMFHCHELHHASAGMVTELMYSDYKTDYVADPNAGNKPE
jgi:FtsP/CotA-like multicopper oxidase with cupredoxin domain